MDQEFKIIITGDASSGIAATRQAGDATKKLKVDTSDLSDEWKRQNGILPDLNDKVKKSGEEAVETGISQRELGKALLDIGNVAAPGAGRAMSELRFGPLGAALALVSAYEMVKKSIDDASEAADKLAEECAKPDTAGIKGVQDAWEKATDAYAEYLANLKNAGADKDPIKTEVDRAKETTLARLEGQKKIQEAMGDQAGAAYTQAAIDKTKGSSGLLLEQGEREKAQAALKADADAKGADQLAADKQFQNDQAKLQAARDATDPQSEKGKALQKKIEDANAALKNAQSLPDTTLMSVGGTTVEADNREAKAKAIAEADREAKAAQLELDNQKREKNTLEANEISRKAAKDEADAAAQKAKEAAVQNDTRLKQLPTEIKQDTQKEDIEEHSRKVIEVLNTHGGQTNQTLAQLATETGKSQAQTIAIVESIVSGHATFSQRMSQLEAQMRQLSYLNK